MAEQTKTRVVQRLGRNGKEYVQNTMRFHPSLYEALRDSAKAAGRTMNAEVVIRLSASFGEGFKLQLPASEDSVVASMADDIRAIRQFVESFARGAA